MMQMRTMGLWVSERYNRKGPAGDRAWDHCTAGVPSANRFLELADIALGLKKSPHKTRKISSNSAVIRQNAKPDRVKSIDRSMR